MRIASVQDRLTQLAARRERRQRKTAPASQTVPTQGMPGAGEGRVPPSGLPHPLSTQETTSMTDQDLIYSLPRTKMTRIVEDIETARQRKDDANTAHMTEWKAAKDAGAPVEALKLCLKLDRMSAEKRSDFLRGFDELRGKYYADRWGAQPDMLDAANDDDQAGEEANGDDAEPEEHRDIAARQDGAERPAVSAVEEGAETGHADNPTGAVGAFNAGKEAGRRGEESDTNPHSGRTATGKAWKKGWEAGAAELEVIKQEGVAARQAGKSLKAAPYISDTDPAGAKAWTIGWWRENERMNSAADGTSVIDGITFHPTPTVTQ